MLASMQRCTTEAPSNAFGPTFLDILVDNFTTLEVSVRSQLHLSWGRTCTRSSSEKPHQSPSRTIGATICKAFGPENMGSESMKRLRGGCNFAAKHDVCAPHDIITHEYNLPRPDTVMYAELQGHSLRLYRGLDNRIGFWGISYYTYYKEPPK